MYPYIFSKSVKFLGYFGHGSECAIRAYVIVFCFVLFCGLEFRYVVTICVSYTMYLVSYFGLAVD